MYPADATEPFALLVSDRRTVDQVVDVMRKEGIKPLFPPEEHPEFHPGYYSVSYRDSDNNVIEIYTMKAKE